MTSRQIWNCLAGVMDIHYLSGMAMVLEAEANLTAQNQITIPAAVRKALNLQGGQSRVKFQILPEEGRVLVLRVEGGDAQEDPALEPFLNLLARDLRKHPKRIIPFPAELVKKARLLVKGVDVNLDGPLTGAD
ncbi:MAG TPA: type II toxin-antitoxin system PrlF family antitoxin [Chthoniobacterales bacterium]